MTATVTFTEAGVMPHLRDALRSLTGAAGDRETTWQLGEGEIADGLAVLGQMRQLMDVAEVALVGEGLGRGLPAQESWSSHDWVTRAESAGAPAPQTRQIAQVLRVAKGEPRVAAVTEAFVDGDLPLGKADQLVRFEAQVAPVADPVELAEAMAVLLEGASRPGRSWPARAGAGSDGQGAGRGDHPHGSPAQAGVRPGGGRPARQGGARPVPLRGADGHDHLPCRARPGGGGGHRQCPGRALRTGQGTGGGARRADALVEAVRRGVSSPGEAPKSDKAQVHVTIPLSTLLGQDPHGGATTMTGQVLAPSVARRMACDAGIIPVVLGGDGEILDMGRSVRLFTPGQRRAVWLRDGGCTYPGCTMPPQWCDAHHVDWWSRGGASDIDNAALLCQRHHTKVHQQDLSATVTRTGVTWHV